MNTVTIEIEDTLQERVDSAIEDMYQEIRDYIEENPDDDAHDWYDQLGGDRIWEIADSNTPIYTKEIEDTYYLHRSELEEAYENMGIGDGGEDNHIQVAIYCYIEQALHEAVNEYEDESNT